jgi:hypothetical protein
MWGDVFMGILWRTSFETVKRGLRPAAAARARVALADALGGICEVVGELGQLVGVMCGNRWLADDGFHGV